MVKRYYFITVFILSFFIEVNAQHDIFIKQVEPPSVHIVKVIDRSKPAGAKSGFSKAKPAAKMVKASARTRTSKDSLSTGNKSALLHESILTEINPLQCQFSKPVNSFILFQSGRSISVIQAETENDYLIQGIKQTGLSNSIIILVPVNALNNIAITQSGSNNSAVIAQNAVNLNSVTLFQRRGFNNITVEQSMSSGPPCSSIFSQKKLINKAVRTKSRGSSSRPEIQRTFNTARQSNASRP